VARPVFQRLLHAGAQTVTETTDDARLREFWDRRYAKFTLSESGWLGAGEELNDRIYACKRQALSAAIAALGLPRDGRWSVLDAGCGQGHFARFYRTEYPATSYTGLDISERAIAHLKRTIADADFRAANLCEWADPDGRTFDIVQSVEVLHLILDDGAWRRALANLARALGPRSALLVTAALPGQTVQPSDYLRFRSRALWDEAIASLGLRRVAERPMYYWLPAGGPANKYLRYGLARMGPGALYALDRAALGLGLPQPASAGIDSRMRLLTLQRA
jgi:SAM-dependent methyltransferase